MRNELVPSWISNLVPIQGYLDAMMWIPPLGYPILYYIKYYADTGVVFRLGVPQLLRTYGECYIMKTKCKSVVDLRELLCENQLYGDISWLVHLTLECSRFLAIFWILYRSSGPVLLSGVVPWFLSWSGSLASSTATLSAAKQFTLRVPLETLTLSIFERYPRACSYHFLLRNR